MQPDRSLMFLALGLMLLASCEAFFLNWSSHSSSQPSQKPWLPPASYRYYSYNPYESRKMYQMSPYAQPEMQYQGGMAGMAGMGGMGGMAGMAGVAPIPISVPAGASLTPVSLQHVQLVPCMCPVAPEEADKLQDAGPGPYLAQTMPAYAPQPDASKVAAKQ